ncbi:unnamed protein product [Absidia cylindrospora]
MVGSQATDDPNQGPTHETRTTPCFPLVFPFSISPFDTSLDTTFFSLGNQPDSLRSTTPPPHTSSYFTTTGGIGGNAGYDTLGVKSFFL